MFNHILYGGDYSPNQWPEATWDDDLVMFDQAGINSATINVFSWAKLQPSETEYDFSELDRIVAKLSQVNVDIVMATSTAALPAWMFQRYPEVGRTDYEGRRHRFGQRHNACPNSRVYQHYVKELVARLAERYGDNPHMVCWHVNNEYGGTCYCENCEKAFQGWLKQRYGTIEALNRAWNLEFWGHTVTAWDQVVVPNALGDGLGNGATAFAGLSTDYMRFNSDSMLANFKLEKQTIRQFDATTPITTNLMGTYKELNYFDWAKELDIVSWDNYPSYDTPASVTAMRHDLMRGLKQQPFMLMEQTPSQQNWQPYNSLKKPGQMRQQSYQAMAHGADTIQFFQLKQSVGGCEKFHGAVIAHSGSNQTRVFKEVSQLGAELKQLDGVIGAETKSDVGIIFDWENFWAYDFTSGPNQDLNYVAQVHQYYDYFYRHHYAVDMVADSGDFSRYKLLVAPALYMVKPGVKQALEAYVQAGGTLVLTTMAGIVDASDNVYLGGYPGPLRELAGIWVEEVDALAPEQHTQVTFTDGQAAVGTIVADIIHPESAEVLASYADNFYAGTPAVTLNRFGQGQVAYVGTILDTTGLDHLLGKVVAQAAVQPVIADQTVLEVTARETATTKYTFVMNPQWEAQPLPVSLVGQIDRLSGEALPATVPGYATYLIVTTK